MIMRSDTTNENILVTAVVSPTQLAVQRAVGTVVPAVINTATSVCGWLVMRMRKALRPQSLIILPQRVINYTQIFRNSWAV
jgi:uncharacterized membrane protein